MVASNIKAQNFAQAYQTIVLIASSNDLMGS